MRERAVDVRPDDLRRRADIGFVQLAVAVDPEQRQADADLVFEDLEQPHDPRPAGRRQPVHVKPADDDAIGAENDRLDDIGAARDRAVDPDLAAPADRLDDLRHDRDRPDPLVELAPAMVRDIDDIDAVIDRDPGILAGRDALDDDRDLRQSLDALDVAPVEPRLIDPRVADPDAAALVPLRDIALAPTVAVGVDRQAERVVAAVHRAPDMVVDPRLVAAHIELEDAEPVPG